MCLHAAQHLAPHRTLGPGAHRSSRELFRGGSAGYFAPLSNRVKLLHNVVTQDEHPTRCNAAQHVATQYNTLRQSTNPLRLCCGRSHRVQLLRWKCERTAPSGARP
jgi:hypothetical protein